MTNPTAYSFKIFSVYNLFFISNIYANIYNTFMSTVHDNLTCVSFTKSPIFKINFFLHLISKQKCITHRYSKRRYDRNKKIFIKYSFLFVIKDKYCGSILSLISFAHIDRKLLCSSFNVLC